MNDKTCWHLVELYFTLVASLNQKWHIFLLLLFYGEVWLNPRDLINIKRQPLLFFVMFKREGIRVSIPLTSGQTSRNCGQYKPKKCREKNWKLGFRETKAIQTGNKNCYTEVETRKLRKKRFAFIFFSSYLSSFKHTRTLLKLLLDCHSKALNLFYKPRQQYWLIQI